MRVALAQITSGPEPAANLTLLTSQAEEAAAAGAAVVVFPEATMSWFATNPRHAAEPVDGPWSAAVVAIAARLGITVVVGTFTRTEQDGDRVRNTLLVTDGHRTSRYDKIHLFDAFGQRESDAVVPGTAPLLETIDGVRTGLATCYDLRFPELYKGHALAGAELIITPASWGAGPGKVEMWRTLAIARALDTTCWHLACGQADPSASGIEAQAGPPTGIGHSMVVSPLGEVVAEAGAGPELLIVDIDPDAVVQARESLPVLANTRLIHAD